MNPVVLSVSIPATVLQLQVNASEETVEGPATDIPELQALNLYAGEWEDEIAGKPGMRRMESATWILQGRFLRQSWTADTGDGSPTASGVYRNWAFLATGSVIENEGTWDAERSTFAWGHRLTDTSETVITKAVFEGAGTLAWSIVKTDVHGKIVREVAGLSRRKNLPSLQAA